jgi:hypothetical protein
MQATVQIITQGQPYTAPQNAVIGAEKGLTAETQQIILRQIHAELGKTPSNQWLRTASYMTTKAIILWKCSTSTKQDSVPQSISVS